MNLNSYDRTDRGYALLGVLVLLMLGLLVTGGMLDSAATNTKTRALVKTRAEYYYEVEETLNKTVAWMQENSKNLVSAFTADNFDTNFDLGVPTLGDNEGEHFGVYSMVKMAGTNNSVMLSNNEFFGTAAFPATENVDTGTAFDAVTAFQNADLGIANARVVLIWARETDGNFEPVFRVDVVTANNPDRGVHSFSYIYSTLSAAAGSVGFYGRDQLTFQTPNNDCYSYRYTYNSGSGTWSRGAPRSNCPVASDQTIDISSDIYGTAKTKLDDGISLNPPGGDVSGTMCDGPACHSYSLPSVNTWAGYCPTHSGDASLNSNTTWGSGGCWRDVTIGNNRRLTLTDYNNPYYFRTLTYGGNNAELAFGNIPPGEKIRIYLQAISANGASHINGKKYINTNNAPHQVEFYYLGTDTLQLNGTVEMSSVIYAPNAPVIVNGNFNFYGGIHALDLTISGNARVNYDETDATLSSLNDIKFALKKASQRYR
ncbi:MAG: hypothetical protein KDD69_14200 [Bdellovibrionales bacterium]|nr:hypothetical protein [Bdellovibrionales bacterium]